MFGLTMSTFLFTFAFNSSIAVGMVFLLISLISISLPVDVVVESSGKYCLVLCVCFVCFS